MFGAKLVLSSFCAANYVRTAILTLSSKSLKSSCKPIAFTEVDKSEPVTASLGKLM